jgi:hypothetical protein
MSPQPQRYQHSQQRSPGHSFILPVYLFGLFSFSFLHQRSTKAFDSGIGIGIGYGVLLGSRWSFASEYRQHCHIIGRLSGRHMEGPLCKIFRWRRQVGSSYDIPSLISVLGPGSGLRSRTNGRRILDFVLILLLPCFLSLRVLTLCPTPQRFLKTVFAARTAWQCVPTSPRGNNQAEILKQIIPERISDFDRLASA